MSEKNYFEVLASVDCSGSIEKKGGFSYLSWAFAVDALLRRHPESAWTVYDFDGSPYKCTPAGCFVKVGVTVNGIERVQWHPVLGNNNKTVKEPDAFQINTSIQRALTKAIALHGLGLSIYQGEDVPKENGTDEIKPQPKPSSAKSWMRENSVTAKTPSFAKLVEKGWPWEQKINEWLSEGESHSLKDFEGYVERLGVCEVKA